MNRLTTGILTTTLALAACGGSTDSRSDQGSAARPDTAHTFPPAPAVPDGPLAKSVDAAASRLVTGIVGGKLDRDAVAILAGSRDARLAWLVSDLLRFVPDREGEEALVAAFEALSGTRVRDHPSFRDSPWLTVTDHLIAWDLPAPPSYRERKGRLYAVLEPRWKPFFDDPDAEIDWRLVSWGGVLIDDRPAGDPNPCPRSCIPALDDPALTDAAAGDWYPDDRIVFGVVVGGEAVAFPRNIMEVHEMVNITIGGRRLGIPYCTLCGSAQAYVLDRMPDGVTQPVLRTSGLLARSNKVMYDLRTTSLIDTFTGRALSGPLQAAGVTLGQTTVVTSTWGAWKRAHPTTRIVAEDGGIGRELRGRPARRPRRQRPDLPCRRRRPAAPDSGPGPRRRRRRRPARGVPGRPGPCRPARREAGRRRGCRCRGRRRRPARADPHRPGAAGASGVLVRVEPVPPRHATLEPTGMMRRGHSPVPTPQSRSCSSR